MKFALFCVRLRSCRVATPRSLAFRRTLSDPYRIGVCEISCFDAFYWKSKTVQRPFALHGFRIRIVGVNVCRMQMRACHAISIPLGKGVGDVLSGLAPCRPATLALTEIDRPLLTGSDPPWEDRQAPARRTTQ